jgi:hypothetical protein
MGVHVEALVAALRAAGHEVCVVGPPAYDAVALGGENRLARVRRLLPGVLGELAEMAYGVVSTARLARAARTLRARISSTSAPTCSMSREAGRRGAAACRCCWKSMRRSPRNASASAGCG